MRACVLMVLLALPVAVEAGKTVKHGAPVAADLDMGTEQAIVHFSFSAPATGAYVEFRGINGVQQPVPGQVRLGAVAAGPQPAIAIRFELDDDVRTGAKTAPQLAVFVYGYFSGRLQSRAFSAAVPLTAGTQPGMGTAGEPDPAVQTDHKGRPIHVLPAD